MSFLDRLRDILVWLRLKVRRLFGIVGVPRTRLALRL